MSEWNYVGAAFGLTWLVFAGYSLYLSVKVRRAQRGLQNAARSAEVGR
jgi:hypothetical protein